MSIRVSWVGLGRLSNYQFCARVSAQRNPARGFVAAKMVFEISGKKMLLGFIIRVKVMGLYGIKVWFS